MDQKLEYLLDIVDIADTVSRPAADLKVGDPVVACSQRPGSSRRGKVEKIGRTWITVSGVRFQFRRDTLYSATGTGARWWLITPEQQEYDRRMREARERIRSSGFALSSYQCATDGQILAVAALLELLDHEQARKEANAR